jgi:hypothetical protein
MRYEPNALSPNVIGGSPANNVTAGVYGATIGGGGEVPGNPPIPYYETLNRVTDAYGTVGGGFGNRAGDDVGTTTDARFATVGGGFDNQAHGAGSTVAGGRGNFASGDRSTVGGGEFSMATGAISVVAGGLINTASGGASTVGGGYANRATNAWSTVGGGSGNNAAGDGSTVPGGHANVASGDGSFAAGSAANAQFHGCYVWADTSSQLNYTSCSAANQFVARALGGFYFFTGGDSDATYTGAQLATGSGAWAVYSDRRGKREFRPVDAAAVLDKVVSLPISTWQWKAEADGIRHMGPTAQDFRAAFGLGPRETEIVTVDADGVALAAIQGLNAKLQAEVAALRAELAELRALVVGRSAGASR